METLLKAIREWGKDHPTAPGLTIAMIEQAGFGEVYYASIVKYADKFAQSKTVVCRCTEKTLDEAITSISKKFLNYLGRGSAITELELSLRGK